LGCKQVILNRIAHRLACHVILSEYFPVIAGFVFQPAGARGDAGGGPSLWCQAALCVLARAM